MTDIGAPRASELWGKQVWLGDRELVGVVVAVGCARGGVVRKVGVSGSGRNRPLRFFPMDGARLDGVGVHIAEPLRARLTA